MANMSEAQHTINRLVPVRNLLEKGLVIQADRELDRIINELVVVVNKEATDGK